MRRIIFFLLTFLFIDAAKTQLVVILQSPPAGFTYKPQLWTMVLSNTGTQPISLHIEVTLNASGSAQQVMTGVTKTFNLPTGATQINLNQLMPVQYNILASGYNIDPNPLGLLPLGEFEVCYHFFKHGGDAIEQIAEQCQDITIGPMSPPQLIYPYDQTSIEETHPQFSWLPPVPVNLFSNLSYDFFLVEINANQSAADAVQQNVPIYHTNNLAASNLLYPVSAPGLQFNQRYAWKINAKSNNSVVAQSEVWEFALKQFGSVSQDGNRIQPFIELKKSPENAYSIFVGDIKFSYLNETADSGWRVKIIDLTDLQKNPFQFAPDSLPLKRGQNLVEYNAKDNSYFVDKHIYQIELYNSRNEAWRLRFEYRKPNEANN